MAGQKGRSRCSGSKKRENSRQELERARGTLGEKCTLFSTVRQVGGKGEGVGVDCEKLLQNAERNEIREWTHTRGKVLNLFFCPRSRISRALLECSCSVFNKGHF